MLFRLERRFEQDWNAFESINDLRRRVVNAAISGTRQEVQHWFTRTSLAIRQSDDLLTVDKQRMIQALRDEIRLISSENDFFSEPEPVQPPSDTKRATPIKRSTKRSTPTNRPTPTNQTPITMTPVTQSEVGSTLPDVSVTDVQLSFNKVDPEVFIHPERRDQLLGALTRFADLVASRYLPDILKGAELHDAFIYDMKPYFDAPPPLFANKLYVKLADPELAYTRSSYHPLVSLLKHLPKLYDCPDRDQELFEHMVKEGEENLKILKIRRAVGRIETSQGTGIGTGVLVDGYLLLTCQEALKSISADDKRRWVRFGNQTNMDAADDNLFEIDLDAVAFEPAFGYALLRIISKSIISRQPEFSPLSPVNQQLQKGEEIHLIHYPTGERVVVSYLGTIIWVGTDVIHHNIMTERGSVGGPIFDKDWQLVALHRSESSGDQQLRQRPANAIPIRAFYEGIREYLPLER